MLGVGRDASVPFPSRGRYSNDGPLRYPAMIELRTLGTLDLRGPGGEEFRSVLTQPKRVALLIYLALSSRRGFVRRDKICGVFWPDSDQLRARASLRQALHVLRGALGGGVVRSRGQEDVGIDAESLWCDASAFEEALEREQPAEAVELYGGDLLEGFFLPNARGFEVWLDRRRRSLRFAAAEAAWSLADRARDEEAWKEAVQHARWALSLRPMQETGVRRLIELLDRAGDRAGAIRAYEEFAARLEREYDVPPAPETRELVEELRARSASRNGEPGRGSERPAEVAPTLPVSPPGQTAGVPPTPGTREGREPARRPRVWAAAGVGTLVLAAIGSWSVLQDPGPSPSAFPSASETPAVAVLPFERLDGSSQPDPFGIGLSEDLVSRLTRVDGLRVVGTAARAGPASEGSALSEIADELGADVLVRGTVGRDGGRVRVTAQLFDPRTRTFLWAESFDRELDDVFRIQGELATRIAGAMIRELSPEEEERLRTPPTTSVTAWSYTERARAIVGSGNVTAHRDRLLELTGNALALDSTLAPAHALRGLALALGADPLDLALQDSALAAAERAVSLDPGHFLGWFALGFLTRWNGPLSRHLEARLRAVELKPDDLLSLRGMALYYQETGRADTHLRWIERANAGNPEPARRYSSRAWVYWIVGGYGRAEEGYRSAIELYSDDFASRTRLAQIALSRGDTASARTEMEAALAIAPEHRFVLETAALVELHAGRLDAARRYAERLVERRRRLSITTGLVPTTLLGYVHAKQGRPAEAERYLDRSQELDRALVPRRYIRHPHYDLARVHAIRGELEEANRWLRRAVEGGWAFGYTYMGPRDPMLESLRGDPEFEAIMARARARLDAQRRRIEEMPLPPDDEAFWRMIEEARAELERLPPGG